MASRQINEADLVIDVAFLFTPAAILLEHRSVRNPVEWHVRHFSPVVQVQRGMSYHQENKVDISSWKISNWNTLRMKVFFVIIFLFSKDMRFNPVAKFANFTEGGTNLWKAQWNLKLV